MQASRSELVLRPVHVPLFPDEQLQKSDISVGQMKYIFDRFAQFPQRLEVHDRLAFSFVATVLCGAIGCSGANADNALLIGGLCCGLLIINAFVLLDYLFTSSMKTQAWKEKRDLRIRYEDEFNNSQEVSDFYCSLMLRIQPGSDTWKDYDYLYSKLRLDQIVKGLNLAVIAETKAGTGPNFGQSLRTTILKWNLSKFAPHVQEVFTFIIELEKQKRDRYPGIPITQLMKSTSIRPRFEESPYMLEATKVHFTSQMTETQLDEMQKYSLELEAKTNEAFRRNYFKALLDDGAVYIARKCDLTQSPQYSRLLKTSESIRFTGVCTPELMHLLKGYRCTPVILNLTKRLGLVSNLNMALSEIVTSYRFSINGLQENLFDQFATRAENIAKIWFDDRFKLSHSNLTQFEACATFCRHVGLPQIPVLIANKLVEEYRHEYQRLNRPTDLLYVHRACKAAGLKTSFYAEYINTYFGPGKTNDLHDHWILLSRTLQRARYNEMDDFLAYFNTPEGRVKLSKTYLLGLPADLEGALLRHAKQPKHQNF